MEIMRVENLTKVYGKGENEVRTAFPFRWRRERLLP